MSNTLLYSFLFMCFFKIKYEGTKQKLMEMVNFIFLLKVIKYPAGYRISSKSAGYLAKKTDTGYPAKVNIRPDNIRPPDIRPNPIIFIGV